MLIYRSYVLNILSYEVAESGLIKRRLERIKMNLSIPA